MPFLAFPKSKCKSRGTRNYHAACSRNHQVLFTRPRSISTVQAFRYFVVSQIMLRIWQLKLMYSWHSLFHTYIHTALLYLKCFVYQSCISYTQCPHIRQGQFGVQSLAQGHLGMWSGSAGYRTTDPPTRSISWATTAPYIWHSLPVDVLLEHQHLMQMLLAIMTSYKNKEQIRFRSEIHSRRLFVTQNHVGGLCRKLPGKMFKRYLTGDWMSHLFICRSHSEEREHLFHWEKPSVLFFQWSFDIN